MAEWILIGILSLCLGVGIILATLCVLYKKCDEKHEEIFEEWLNKKMEKEKETGDK